MSDNQTNDLVVKHTVEKQFGFPGTMGSDRPGEPDTRIKVGRGHKKSDIQKRTALHFVSG